MSSSAASPPLVDLNRRPGPACLRCRASKIKCRGEAGQSCQSCLKTGQDCVFPDAEDKVYVSKRRLQELEELERRSLRQEAISQPVPSSSAVIPHVQKQGRVETQSSDIEINPLVTSIADLSISPSGNPQYLGISSSLALGLRLRDIVTTFRPGDDTLDIEKEHATYDPAALKPRRHSILHHVRLPPYHFALRLFAAQHTYLGTIFGFVPKERFEARLMKAYQGTPDLSDREACLAYAEVLVVLAFGQMYSVNQWNGYEGPPGFDYFTQALQFMPEIHEDGSVLFVEVLALVGYFMQNLGRRDCAFLYLGVALRMAVSLALHQEVSDSRIGDVEKEHRRRLWWSVYSLDRILCAKSGNPITILDEDIGVAAPSPILGLESETCPAITLLHYTELSRILGRIMKSIYRKSPKSGFSLMNSVQEIMTSLATWNRDLPAHLRFDPNKLNSSRESVSTFLHYHQCVNMAARPLLFAVVQKRLEDGLVDKEKDWRSGLSPTTINVIEACTGVARNTVTMMTVAAQKDLVATYGWMDGEHCFSAAAVLVMVCVAFPFNAADVAAMDGAFQLLQSMAERGNPLMGTRLQLLLRLRSLTNLRRHDSSATIDLMPQMSFSPYLQTSATTFEMPNLTNMNDEDLEEMFAIDANQDDFGLWEASYTNADVNMDHEMAQWKANVNSTASRSEFDNNSWLFSTTQT